MGVASGGGPRLRVNCEHVSGGGDRWATRRLLECEELALDAAGAKYISADAQSSSAKQLSDVEALIAQGADALIILAQDASAL